MTRKEYSTLTRKGQDATCVTNRRGVARRVKRQGAKRLRQRLKRVDSADVPASAKL